MKKYCIALLTAILLVACGETTDADDNTYAAPAKGETFSEPDVKDDFCGIHIDMQYCTCAFQNDNCESINMNKTEANAHLASEFGQHVAKQLRIFSSKCGNNSGFVKNKTCYTCPKNTEREKGRCKTFSGSGV